GEFDEPERLLSGSHFPLPLLSPASPLRAACGDTACAPSLSDGGVSQSRHVRGPQVGHVHNRTSPGFTIGVCGAGARIGANPVLGTGVLGGSNSSTTTVQHGGRGSAAADQHDGRGSRMERRGAAVRLVARAEQTAVGAAHLGGGTAARASIGACVRASSI
uniref:Uncharacterized protein n=1 Tax=Aegilops tauschii subsp. strangulata TaxID=200361 RepID=A0A453SI69_AEGTS